MIKINQRLTNSKALREYKQTITLNQIQKDVLVGTLLGDASIPLDRGKPTLRVEFEQKSASADYIWHLYDIFQKPDFVGTAPRVYTRGAGARVYQSLQFQTFRHNDFKLYYDIFYLDYKDNGTSSTEPNRRKKRAKRARS